MSRYFILVFTMCVIVDCQDVKPKFRILAPQFICGSEKAEENSTNLVASTPGVTTIRLQAASGQELNYNWTVRFKVIDGPRGQRFNLLVWRAARNLEKTLTSMSPEISSSNMVNINNTMLVEGVNYVFNISGSNNKGIYGDMRSFSIKFQDANDDPKFDIEGASVDKQFSILMLGSDVTYVDVQYIIEAHVTPCKPTNDYFYVWSVKDLYENHQVDVSQQKGKRLIIPPGKLIGGREYDIHCGVYKISNNDDIASKGIFLITKIRGMSVELNVQKLIMAANNPITLVATFKNPDNKPGNILIEWSCKTLSGSKICENFKSVNQTELTIAEGFQTEGEYQFEVSITKGDEKVSKTCTLIIQNGMIPTIDISSISVLAISDQPLEIPAKVTDLRSGCNLKWISLQEDGFVNLDISLLPQNGGNSLLINSKDETFLSEIVEFTNETVYKSFPLLIPGSTGTWPGLKPNEKYKFRLLVECTCSLSIECEGPKNVSAFSDVIVQTNKPPIAKPLKIKPTTGFALKTVFQFSTSAAIDLLSDYPLTYIYGYKIMNEIYVIKSYIENLAVDTILPYSSNMIIPTLNVCDSRGACSRIDGDLITVTKPENLTMEDLTLHIDIFQFNLYRQEYFDGFNLLSIIIQTIKALEANELMALFIGKVENIIQKDIERQINDVKSSGSSASSNEFIFVITKFIEKFSVFDNLIQDIIKLRDLVFEVISQSSKTNTEPEIVKRELVLSKIHIGQQSFKNYQNYKHKRDLSSEDLKNLLKVSEYVIMTSKNEEQVENEKQNVLSKLYISMRELCKTEYSQKSIDTRIVSMSVGNVNLKTDMNLYIPYNPTVESQINNSAIAHMFIVPKANVNLLSSYCIARSLYSIKLFNSDKKQKGWIYHVTMFNKDSKELMNDFEIVLKIPVVETFLEKNYILQCSKWNGNNWDETSCLSNEKYSTSYRTTYVICKCNSFGFFSLYESANLLTTTQFEISNSNENTTFKDILPTVQDIEYSHAPLTEVFEIFASTTTSDNNDYKKSSSSDKIILFCVIGLCLCGLIPLLIFIITRKIRRNKKYRKTIPVNVTSSHDEPIYRKFHAEHLMDGSMESLARFETEKVKNK